MPDLILLNVRWYCRYPLSYRNLEEMMQERGVVVDHSTLKRWVLKYAPEFDLKADEQLPEPTELRQVKYLNNIVEQDHWFIKRLAEPGMGFGSFNSARRTLRGFEAMNMIRKGQVQGVEKGDIRAQTEFVSQLFGFVA